MMKHIVWILLYEFISILMNTLVTPIFHLLELPKISITRNFSAMYFDFEKLRSALSASNDNYLLNTRRKYPRTWTLLGRFMLCLFMSLFNC